MEELCNRDALGILSDAWSVRNGRVEVVLNPAPQVEPDPDRQDETCGAGTLHLLRQFGATLGQWSCYRSAAHRRLLGKDDCQAGAGPTRCTRSSLTTIPPTPEQGPARPQKAPEEERIKEPPDEAGATPSGEQRDRSSSDAASSSQRANHGANPPTQTDGNNVVLNNACGIKHFLEAGGHDNFVCGLEVCDKLTKQA